MLCELGEPMIGVMQVRKKRATAVASAMSVMLLILLHTLSIAAAWAPPSHRFNVPTIPRRPSFAHVPRSSLILPLCSSSRDEDTIEYDGGILVGERVQIKLFIFEGGTSSAERNWDNPDNKMWSMKLKDAKGVAEEDIKKYNNLWRGDNSINDARRIIHKGKIHILVTGNGGDGVAMYRFDDKKCIYWSKTTCKGPHDAEYIPKRGGYLVVANAQGSDSNLELYDISTNNQGRIPGSVVKQKGVHGVHWDAEKDRLWAWGSTQDGLKSYRVKFDNSVPKLVKDDISYTVTKDFEVGTGHGAAPMLEGNKRYLILAGKDGILRFNTKNENWKILQRATEDKFENPKGLSHNPETGEIITTKNKSKVYSVEPDVGDRKRKNSKVYKARWWFPNTFSQPEQ